MKVTLKKGFRHLGRLLKEGDEYVGDPFEITALRQQGYVDEAQALLTEIQDQLAQIKQTIQQLMSQGQPQLSN